MKKKLFSLLLLGGLTLTAGAQQLPNIGFSNWKSACGSTEAFGTGGLTSSKTGEMRKRPGVEPTDWNGSSINQRVIMQKQETLIYNEDQTVKMQNKFVGVGTIGSVAPGFINLGTPWVYAISTIEECDGGAYGGVTFTYKPDAITGRYKRTDATGETSHIIAYLWSGTFVSKVGSKSSPGQARNNVDRAIFGKTTPTSSGTLIASCDYTFTSTTSSDWQTITVPLTYHNTTTAPTMMNAIISAGDYWTRTNMEDGTTLYADDVKFVYYSTLKSLSYNGESLTIPAAGGTVDKSTVVYDESKLACTANGQSATITKTYDAATNKLTITVSNVDADIDGLSSHTYYIQFAKPGTAALTDLKYNGTTLAGFSSSTYNYTLEGSKYTEGCLTYTKEDGEDATANVSFAGEDGYGVATITVTATYGGASKVYTVTFAKPAPVPVSSTDYVDDLLVVINGECFDPQGTTINVSKYDDDTYTLSLQNFMLVAGEDVIPVGNIVLEGMTATEDNGTLTFNTTQAIQIQPGTLAGISPEDWLGPMLGDVPIVMTAKIADGKLKCDIDIDMTALLGQVINVYFGVLADNPADNEVLSKEDGVHVILNRTFKAGWSTLALQYGLQGENLEVLGASKIMQLSGVTDDGTGLLFAESASMEASVPYLVYFENEVVNPFFKNVNVTKTAAEPFVKGDWRFVGTFTPIAAPGMEGKYGVTEMETVDGQPYQALRRGSDKASIGGTRAYFEYTGTQNVQTMRLYLDGETTAIGCIENGQLVVTEFPADVYSLDGRLVKQNAESLNGLAKGIYVVNGKKMMVK